VVHVVSIGTPGCRLKSDAPTWPAAPGSGPRHGTPTAQGNLVNSTRSVAQPADASDRPVLVSLFDAEPSARLALQALHDLGLTGQDMGLLVPAQGGAALGSPEAEAEVSGLLARASGAGDVGAVLHSMGVPEGEARFYEQEVHEGRTLVVVAADGAGPTVRETLLRYGGYDVQSRGGDLARPTGAGVPGGTGARPIDVSGEWEDVASRYRMLWQQHYGTTDATWEQVEPIYQYAWETANDPVNRGRPWSDVEAELARDWQSMGQDPDWAAVAGPIRDVWEDVAAEAAQGAEGGQDRRVARPDDEPLQPPTYPAAS
jgi:hypothetical protein